MAADDDTMFDATESATAAMAPPFAELPTAPFTGNKYIHTNAPQLQQGAAPQPTPPSVNNNQYCQVVGGTIDANRCMMSHLL